MLRPYRKQSYQAHNSYIYITKVSLTVPPVSISNSVFSRFRKNYFVKATNSDVQSSK